jgi:hypothetical protein
MTHLFRTLIAMLGEKMRSMSKLLNHPAVKAQRIFLKRKGMQGVLCGNQQAEIDVIRFLFFKGLDHVALVETGSKVILISNNPL